MWSKIVPDVGLVRQIIWEDTLLFQRTRVSFPAPTSDSSQVLATQFKVTWHSLWPHQTPELICTYPHTESTRIHIIETQISFSKYTPRCNKHVQSKQLRRKKWNPWLYLRQFFYLINCMCICVSALVCVCGLTCMYMNLCVEGTSSVIPRNYPYPPFDLFKTE